MATKFEYHWSILDRNPDRACLQMNELGWKGWRMCGCHPLVSKDPSKPDIAYFFVRETGE